MISSTSGTHECQVASLRHVTTAALSIGQLCRAYTRPTRTWLTEEDDRCTDLCILQDVAHVAVHEV